MNGKINGFFKGRSVFIIIICTILWLVLIGRLFYMQIMEYDRYQGEVIKNVQRETTVNAQRGNIYDCNMVPLAINATVYRIFISPSDITDTNQARLISTNLSQILDVDYDMIIKKTEMIQRKDETIKKNVEEGAAKLVRAFIKDNGLERQIHLVSGTKRYYQYGSLASHVLGFTGVDDQGLFGLEYQYDRYLKGVPGRFITAKNAVGKDMPFKYESYVEPQNGANLVTTIDMKIQFELEAQLKATNIESQAQNRVAGIVMDVNTGDILAMAVEPDFDLNNPYTLNESSMAKLNLLTENTDEYTKLQQSLRYEMWNNKAVSGLYEPGSTFKIITSAMALEENLVKIEERFVCTGAHYVSGYSKPIRCHLRTGHGSVSFEEGLQQSCNPLLMTIAERIGRDLFYEYFTAFGFTEKTGIDLPSEAASYYHKMKNFNQVELAVYSFGQTFKVTPLQQLTAICTVANGGYLVTPKLVKQLVDENLNVVQNFEPVIKRQVISSETCKTLTGILERGVAGNGGAKNAYVRGYRVAAKTGTSEVRDKLNEQGEAYLRVGSCVAYAPADNPQIAVLIMVDEPSIESVYGSVVAAPYVSKLLGNILSYKGIEPKYTEKELVSMEVNITDYRGLKVVDVKKDIDNRGIKYEIQGNGDIVNYQIPKSGTQLSKDTGKIILYTGDTKPEDTITVPKVVGMTAKEANRILTNAGFNIKIEGALNYGSGAGAIVVKQSPNPSEKVSYGSVVVVEFRHFDGID